jgi:hypothetical protein
MKGYKFLLLIVLVGCLLPGPILLIAQTHRTCATVEINEAHKSRQLTPETEVAFEKWLKDKINYTQNNALHKTTETVYIIPVVVHIIHNGEPVGTSTNISAARVESQIRVLNEDYRRKQGTRGYNTNRVGADTHIEFRLAVRDPEGFPTSGIVRKQGTQRSWTAEDETTLKSLSYWPAEAYLNIWVCNLDDDVLGYAQFPESNQIPGVSEVGEEEARLDGVVVGYQYFGDQGEAANSDNDFRYGRTTTHEVGHFLGLRHIWGDPPSQAQGCLYDDYCQDTPNTTGPNYDCPRADSTDCTTPKQREMVENYMDYTDDACMNLFTQEQTLRMRTVLENSPRRVSLLSSQGLIPVVLPANNARITQIINPDSVICDSIFSPVIVLRNYGSNLITQVTVSYSIEDRQTKEFSWTGNLATAQTDTIALPAIEATPGSYTLGVSIVRVNTSPDSEPLQNVAQVPFRIATLQPIPDWINFNQRLLAEEWFVLNPDSATTWRDTLVNSNLSASEPVVANRVAYLNYSQYTSSGAQDALITAAYDLSAGTQAYLVFDVAYASRGRAEDGLAVIASTDCGVSFPSNNIIYQARGNRLATATNTSRSWSPTQASEWRTETISLANYIRQGQLRFAFIGFNDQGNNIYIDNIRIVQRPETTEEQVLGYRSLANAIQIYPNPNQGQFSILFNVYEPVDVDVNVYNMMGQLLFSKQILQANDIHKVDLFDLPSGMYIVTFSSENETVSRKMVISP